MDSGMGIKMGGPKKWSEAQDSSFDKKAGIKEGSTLDNRMDKLMMKPSALKADMKKPKIKGMK